MVAEMFNILMDELPEEWNGYKINTWFQIGIQVFQIYEDETLPSFEKSGLIIDLLFGEDDGSLRAYPEYEELNECIQWFLNGWNHDNGAGGSNEVRLMDFDVDQWRIFADFIQIYGINLNDADLHWWEFMGMLWNMPADKSSFMQVIDIRTKKPDKNSSPEYKKSLKRAHQIYDLKQKQKKPHFTSEQEKAIDEYDRMMEEMKKKKTKRQS